MAHRAIRPQPAFFDLFQALNAAAGTAEPAGLEGLEQIGHRVLQDFSQSSPRPPVPAQAGPQRGRFTRAALTPEAHSTAMETCLRRSLRQVPLVHPHALFRSPAGGESEETSEKSIRPIGPPVYRQDTMSGPDRHLTLAMARAWPQLERLAALVAALLGLFDGRVPARISRGARLGALRLLRPAEALVRRLIVMMAYLMDVQPVPAALSPAHVQHETVKRGQGTQPRFRLFEPLPGFARVFAAPAAPQGPEKAGESPAERPVSAAMLVRRLEGLEAVLAAPEAHARRYARWRARRRRMARPGRTDPVRPGYPPGVRSRHTPDWLKDRLVQFASALRRWPPDS